jgi:hypothetical protein
MPPTKAKTDKPLVVRRSETIEKPHWVTRRALSTKPSALACIPWFTWEKALVLRKMKKFLLAPPRPECPLAICTSAAHRWTPSSFTYIGAMFNTAQFCSLLPSTDVLWLALLQLLYIPMTYPCYKQLCFLLTKYIHKYISILTILDNWKRIGWWSYNKVINISDAKNQWALAGIKKRKPHPKGKRKLHNKTEPRSNLNDSDCRMHVTSSMYGIDNLPYYPHLTPSICSNGCRLMSNIKQCTEFLSQDQQSQDNCDAD